MSDIQFWIKNPNDQFDDFNTQIATNVGFAFYSGFSHTEHTVNLFNDHTTAYDSKYLVSDVNNVKFITSGTAQVNEFYSTNLQSSVNLTSSKSPYDVTQVLSLLNVPNVSSTLNMRFVSSSSVNVQNASIKIASITDTSKTPTSCNFKIAQIMHPEVSALGSLGSGDSSWIDVPASTGSVAKSLSDNPGISGIGTGVSSIRHDWYIAISGRSTDIGGQNSQMIFSVEYL